MAKIIADRRINIKKLNDNLGRIKANFKDFHNYFRKNYESFNHFRKFVLETSLSEDDISLNMELQRPQLEFNILEAYVSRLRGEFSKQEPTLTVRPTDDAINIDPQLIQLLDNYVRALIYDANKDNMEYDIYTDLLTGGFSGMKVYTDYTHEMSFNQSIYMRRVYDPTLIGFDKFANTSHKGDGMFCYELYPNSREEVEGKYGMDSTKGMKFTRGASLADFNWSYSTNTGDVVLLGDYYEKKTQTGKIVQLINGQVMTMDEYDEFVGKWQSSGMIIAPPGVIGKPRNTEFVRICQYIISECEILEYNETKYKYLPIIFVDGNSVMLRDNSGMAKQLTRPYVYHAESIQKLKNFAGIMLANELENTVQHKWSVQKEAIPEEYKDAYVNVQKAQVLVWNGFKDNNPDIPLNGPISIPRVPAPPEIMSTFSLSDEITQAILGAYDASLGINNNQLSGKAITDGAMQSNAAAMPYSVSYMKGLNRAAEIVLDLIPKFIITPRRIPIKPIGGKRDYAMVNTPDSPQMDYEPNTLEVKIEAGVNFEVQKQQALMTLTNLMQVNPTFGQFMMTEEGLQALLDNVDIRGIDSIKQGVTKFVQKTEAMQQQQMQMQQQQMMEQAQNNPAAIKREEIMMKAKKNENDAILEAGHLEVDKQQADTDRMVALSQLGLSIDKMDLERDKLQAEQTRSAVEAAFTSIDRRHDKTMDILDMHHKMTEAQHKRSEANAINAG